MDSSKNIKRKLLNISKKTGKGSIYIYYSIGGKEKKFPTGIKIDATKWDKTNSKPRRGSLKDKDQAIVDSLYNKIYKIITDHQFKYNVLPTIQYLENNLEKPETDTENIHELYSEYVKSKEKASLSVFKLHKYTAQNLQEVDSYYRLKLNLHNLNYDFINKFIEYCTTIKKRKIQNNTLERRLYSIKSFVTWLNKREIKHSINPENWEKVEKNHVNLVCLEKNELQDIANFKPRKKLDQKTKDVIVFLAQTGIRSGDLKVIKKENIIDNTIQFHPTKTLKQKIKVVIPISKNVRDILNRYNYHLPYYEDRYLTERIQELCSQIPSLQKEISYTFVEGAEVKEKKVPKYSVLTSHCIGRKTFINICIQSNIPITNILGMTGHTKIDTIIKSYADKWANNLPQLSKAFEM